MCVIPGFPAALLDDPPQPPPAAPTREQHQQSSSDDEHSPKVRKPYTITKQREKWSDEEHDKFLEAVKLYGRAWRRIEEHVGSKTAVQIRSHAQKFFSKVARESTTTAGGDGSSSSSGSNNSSPATATTAAVIEIPPPRPKKRPLHPYPRKQGSTPKKRAPVAATISVVPPHVKPGSCHHHQQHQEENTSPKSVLSAEELIQSPTALKPEACSRGCYGCASSDSSITGPDEAVARQRQETDGSSTMSNGSESYDNMTQEDGRDKDSEHPPAMVSFQLFGQTMFVPNCQSPASSVEESSRHQVTDTLPPLSSDDETSETMEMATDPEVSENPANAHCPCGVVPMLCNPLPTHQQQQQQQWFVFYGGPMTLPFLRLPVTSSQQHHECSMTVADGSSSGSADSVSGHESSENTPKKRSVNQDAEQSEDRSPRSAFLPYKRQTVVVSQHQPSNAADLSL